MPEMFIGSHVHTIRGHDTESVGSWSWVEDNLKAAEWRRLRRLAAKSKRPRARRKLGDDDRKKFWSKFEVMARVRELWDQGIRVPWPRPRAESWAPYEIERLRVSQARKAAKRRRRK